MDADAEFAYRAFCRHVWLLCRNAPERSHTLGYAATRAYLRALRAAGGKPSDSSWRDFVRAVWALVHELDRYPSQASWRWRDAYGALSRILFDNVDPPRCAAGDAEKP